ncbi:MAG: T9SS type B sorting domain-containing protein [Paludibacteraceae bacterium]|nr:T9SS type B sorting domain-containing protein [Paludibacteraceae bacterium]
MIKRLVSAFSLLMLVVGSAFSQSMIISGGGNHAIALCSKGQIFAWGLNESNCLCLKDPADAASGIVPSPSLVNTDDLTFSMVSAGSGGHSVALSCYGTVYCWGANAYSQCGQPASKYLAGGKPLPVKCGEAPGYDLKGNKGGDYLGGVKYITATSGASLAILEDGSCVVWGGNESSVPGEFLKEATETPVYIRDQNGEIIKNIIHVTGGDNNILFIVGDSPDAKVGTVYSMGNWNGRGGDGGAKSYIAAPVEIGDGTGTKSSGKYLTNVRTSGLSDSGGMAVDGITGYVYAWGNNGWWGTCGKQLQYPASAITYAEKVTSGEYEEKSGEPFLTDAIQVIGGNGSAAAVTKEGNILYWGSNTGAKKGGSSGGTIPNSKYAALQNTQSIGPVYGNYCKGENGYATETRVDDAVAIARGDMFGCMVNSKGDFYVWGTTELPGGSGNAGTLGTGNVSEISTCFKKIEVNCTPQDLCPEAYMVGPRYKCPGTVDSLYSGFTPLERSEDNYFYKWTKDGVVLNTSTENSPLADRKKDKYNVITLPVLEPGKYRVDIYYVGQNVPCENCPDTYAEIEVIDMEMPVDTMQPLSCVGKDRETAPTELDNINFAFSVNNKFYKAGTKTTWVVYDAPEDGTALDTFEVLAGGDQEFSVTGNYVKVNENLEKDKPDTTYSIWIEDKTRSEGYFLENASLQKGTIPASAEYVTHNGSESCFFTFMATSNLSLGKFDLVMKSVQSNQAATNVKVDAAVYATTICTNGNVSYLPVATSKMGSATKTVPSVLDPTLVSLDFGGVELPVNPVRGTAYCIVVTVTSAAQVALLETTAAKGDKIFDGAVSLVDGSVTHSIFPEAYSKNAYNFYIHNLEFFKLTEYTCGRIELPSKYYCPPCNKPDKDPKIESTVEKVPGLKVDTVFLCKETGSTTLSVKDVKNSDGDDFDILWYDTKSFNDDTKALKAEEKVATSSIEVKWEDIPEGESKTFYLKVRDHEDHDASLCHRFDSIVVVANKVPEVPEITIDPYCEGQLELTSLTGIAGQLLTIAGYDSKLENEAGDDFTILSFVAELQSLAAPGATYYLTLTDRKTGCVSEKTPETVTVDEIPGTVSPVDLQMLKSEGASESVSAAVESIEICDDCKFMWSKTEDGQYNAVAPNQDKSKAGDFPYWVYVENTKTGCKGKPADFTVTVNDAPAPTVENKVICKSSVPTFNLNSCVTPLEGYNVYWYKSKADAESKDASKRYTAELEAQVGEQTFYVTQQNGDPTLTDLERAESDPAWFTVKVVDVDLPTVLVSENTYCKDAEAASVVEMVDVFKDESSFLYADGKDKMVWKLGSNVVSGTSLIPNTAVENPTEYTYSVYQTYAIPNTTEVCEGKSVDVTVKVTVINAPTKGDFSVQYVKSDAEENTPVGYKNLLAQNENAVKADEDYTLVWYTDETGGTGSSEPFTPAYDASLEEDVTLTYWVSQKNSMGCESTRTPVKVTVSSAPMPKVYKVNYCEGETTVPLVAEITVPRGHNESEYELVWYTDETLTTEASGAPTPESVVPSGTESVKKYYVAQRQISSGAVSSASELVVTVYAKPKLITNNPSPICGTKDESVNLASDEIWKISSSGIGAAKAWLDRDQSTAVDNPSEIKQPGTYYCYAYFEVTNDTKTGLPASSTCKSTVEHVNVDVHFVKDLIVTGDMTCPNTPATLNVEWDESSSDAGTNPTSGVKYTWKCETNNDATTTTVPEYTTPALAGQPGNSYKYNAFVTAGVCADIPVGSYSVVLNDGPVKGNVVFDEEKNSTEKVITAQRTGVTFTTCGNKLTIDAAQLTADENSAYEWTADGEVLGRSAKLVIDEPGDKTYHLTYSNVCKTGFDINIVDASVKVSTDKQNMEICENDNFSSILNIKCKNTPEIKWYRDGQALTLTDNKLNLNPAQLSDKGVYSYEVSNLGCKEEGKLEDLNGENLLNVKPYIKFDMQDFYVARKDSVLAMPITFTQPTSGDPSTIVWTENGVASPQNNPYKLKVTKDHDYTVTMSDPNYCNADTTVKVKVDARLKMRARLSEKICQGAQADLLIDTTGTGNFYYPEKMKLKVTEIIGTTETDMYSMYYDDEEKAVRVSNVSPSENATYRIEFIYREGEGVDEQKIVKELNIEVLPPIQITIPEGLAICGDGMTQLEIPLQVTPPETDVTWEADDDIMSSTSGHSVTVAPEYPEGGESLIMTKVYRFSAANGQCEYPTKMVIVRVDRPLTGNIVAPVAMCEGKTATIDASSYRADTYVWSSQEDPSIDGAATASIDVQPSVTSEYLVDMTRGECKGFDSYTLDIAPLPEIVSVDSVDYNERRINVVSGTSPFTFYVDKIAGEGYDTETLTDVRYGRHTVFVVDAAGCQHSFPFVVVAPVIKIQPVVSPNGDGVYDNFSSKILQEAFPNAKISIFDRWGKKLVTYYGSDPGWDGTYNGKPMPSTDYWYEIEIKELETTYTGHFTLMRQ